MNNKMSIYADLETLTRMCHSKSDGASLRIEEEEIKEKIAEIEQEIAEIKQNSEEEIYDSGAEMADRNIQIILKKMILNLKTDIKHKESDLDALKDQEIGLSNEIEALNNRVKSNSLYTESIKGRLTSIKDEQQMAKYQSQLSETEQEITLYTDDLNKLRTKYEELQKEIEGIVDEITKMKDKLKTKEDQLAETESNLSNKESYIDKTKQEKNDKKISDLEAKKGKLTEKIEKIEDDPKFLEIKIKEIVAKGEDLFSVRPYLNKLVAKALEVPYMNRNLDNSLEEELLNATQERDKFASEMDHKDYSILASKSPEQIRINYLNKRIENWNEEINSLQEKAKVIDSDEKYNYQENIANILETITAKKAELEEYEEKYNAEPEINISAKANLKLLVEETRTSLKSAETIIAAFKTEQAKYIETANILTGEKCDKLNENIVKAQNEIEAIQDRINSKKTGLIDINAQNKDREKLQELAKIVVDIKHRRQFTESPQQIANRLEQNLSVDINASEASVTKVETVQEPKKEEPKTIVEKKKDELKQVEEPAPVTESLEEPNERTEEKTKVESELEEFLNNVNNIIEPGE